MPWRLTQISVKTPRHLIRGEINELSAHCPFGGLFGVTFTVAATFQLTLAALGVVTALLSPGFFKMGVVPASNPAQALGVLLMLTAMLLAMNAMISAAGA